MLMSNEWERNFILLRALDKLKRMCNWKLLLHPLYFLVKFIVSTYKLSIHSIITKSYEES